MKPNGADDDSRGNGAMKPHEIVALLAAETERLVPRQRVMEDLVEELGDLVGDVEAARLIRSAQAEPVEAPTVN